MGQREGKVTIDDLAVMIAHGFDEVHKKFDHVDKKFEAVHQEFETVHQEFEQVHTELHGINERLDDHTEELKEIRLVLRRVERKQDSQQTIIDRHDGRITALESNSHL